VNAPELQRRDRGRHPFLMALPIVFLVGFLLRLYWLESGLKIPIPIKPLAGAVTDTSLFLYWNPVPGESVRYDVQVDGTSARFQNLLYEWKGTPENKLKIREAFPSGAELWWRVRSARGNKASPWSRAISFRTAGSPLPPQPSLEITAVDPTASGLEVAGRASLPDGTVVYMQVADPVDRASLYRLRARIDRDGFRQQLPVPQGYEGKKLLVSVSTWAEQLYPVTETLGERGEALARRSSGPGTVLPALRVSADLPREASSASSASSRRRFSDYYLSLDVRKEEGELVLFGGTNLPEGVLLTAAAARVPNGPPAFSNAVPVKSGRFYARLKSRAGEPPLGEADWRAEVVFDPRFPSSNGPLTDIDRLPASGENTGYTIGDERLFEPGGEDLTDPRADDVN